MAVRKSPDLKVADTLPIEDLVKQRIHVEDPPSVSPYPEQSGLKSLVPVKGQDIIPYLPKLKKAIPGGLPKIAAQLAGQVYDALNLRWVKLGKDPNLIDQAALVPYVFQSVMRNLYKGDKSPPQGGLIEKEVLKAVTDVIPKGNLPGGLADLPASRGLYGHAQWNPDQLNPKEVVERDEIVSDFYTPVEWKSDVEAWNEREGGIWEIPTKGVKKIPFPMEWEKLVKQPTGSTGQEFGKASLNRLIGTHVAPLYPSQTAEDIAEGNIRNIPSEYAEGLGGQYLTRKGETSSIFPMKLKNPDKIFTIPQAVSGLYPAGLHDEQAINEHIFETLFQDSKEDFLTLMDNDLREKGKKIAGAISYSPRGLNQYQNDMEKDWSKAYDKYKKRPGNLGEIGWSRFEELRNLPTDLRIHYMRRYRDIMKDKGYEGIRYINTAAFEAGKMPTGSEARESIVLFDVKKSTESPFGKWAYGGIIRNPYDGYSPRAI
jgi:hypothetical protein